tara:strand:+ start:583 stop:1056 length:474 start_codon:yes stop_codon:yes gene_type:complete
MEINIDRIKSRFNNKIRKEDIIKVYNDFKRIDDVLKLKLGIEESICKYFKCVMNIELCNKEIIDRRMEIKGYENELILMKRESFDELRGNGRLEKFLYSLSNEVLDSLLFMGCVLSEEVSDIKLNRFRKERDENNRNYNDLNLDGNVSVGSNSDSWK